MRISWQRAVQLPQPVLARVLKPTPRSLVRMLSSLGEGETIKRYPDLIDALVHRTRQIHGVNATTPQRLADMGGGATFFSNLVEVLRTPG